LDAVKRRNGEKTPSGINVPVCLGHVECSMQSNQEVTKITGVFVGTDNAWLPVDRVKLVVAHYLHFGVDFGLPQYLLDDG